MSLVINLIYPCFLMSQHLIKDYTMLIYFCQYTSSPHPTPISLELLLFLQQLVSAQFSLSKNIYKKTFHFCNVQFLHIAFCLLSSLTTKRDLKSLLIIIVQYIFHLQ